MACIATWSFGLDAILSGAVDIQNNIECVDVLERATNSMSVKY